MKTSSLPIALLLALLAFPLSSCSTAAAKSDGASCARGSGPCGSARPFAEVPRWSRDAYWATSSHCGVANLVDGMPEARRAEVREAASVLVRNCPYNRSMAQLPQVLWSSLEESFALLENEDAVWQSPVVTDRLRQVRDGLIAHRQVLDALALDALPAPRKGDYLHGRERWMTPLDFDAARLPLLEQAYERYGRVDGLADAYDEDTKARIEEAHATLVEATAKRWPLMAEMDAYRVALQEIQVLAEHYSKGADRDVTDDFARLAVVCAETVEVMNRLLGGYC